jgi:hypothetical protein
MAANAGSCRDLAKYDTAGAVAPVLRAARDAVECWIGLARESDRRIVRLAGRLTEAQVPELLWAGAGAGPVQLDLTELVSADLAGFDALRRMREAGATLVGVPVYIQLRLEPSRAMR